MKRTLSLVLAWMIFLSSGSGLVVTSKAAVVRDTKDCINVVEFDATSKSDTAADYTNYLSCLSSGYLGYCSYHTFEYNCLFSEVPEYVELDITRTTDDNSELCLSLDTETYNSPKKIAVLDSAAILACDKNVRTTVKLVVDSECVIEQGTERTLVLKFQLAGFNLHEIRFGRDTVDTDPTEPTSNDAFSFISADKLEDTNAAGDDFVAGLAAEPPYLGYISWRYAGYRCEFNEVPDYIEIDVAKTVSDFGGSLYFSVGAQGNSSGDNHLVTFDTETLSSVLQNTNQRYTVRLPINNTAITADSTNKIYVNFNGNTSLNFYGFKFIKSDELLLTSVTPSNSTEIDVFLGEIVLQFNREIDDKTIDGKILFTDEDGNAPTGGVQIDCDGKLIKLTFGMLDYSTAYTLEVLSGIKSLDEKTLSNSSELLYTTITSEENVYIEDFSSDDYVVGDEAPETSYLTYSVANETTTDYTLVSQIDGMKYISVGSSVNKSGFAKLKLDDIADEEYYLIKYKVRPSSASGTAGWASRTIGCVLGSSWTVSSIAASLSDSGKVASYTEDSKNKGEGSLSYSNMDSNGFTDVRVYIKKDSDGYVMTEIYNPYNLSAKPFIKHSDGIKLKTLNEFALVNIYPADEAQLSERIDFAQLSVQKGRLPKIVSSETIMSENLFKFIFNIDIDVDTVNDIVLKSYDGNVIDCDVSVEDDRTVIIRPFEYIKSGVEYTFDMKGLKNRDKVNSEAIVKMISDGAETNTVLYNGEGQDISGDDYTNVNKIVLSTDYTGNVHLIASVFDSDGRIIKTIPGEAGVKNLTIDNLLQDDWYKIKLFVWNKTSTGYDPLTGEIYTISK